MKVVENIQGQELQKTADKFFLQRAKGCMMFRKLPEIGWYTVGSEEI